MPRIQSHRIRQHIAPVKVLLTQLFERLQLKEESFKPITAASEEDIDAIWNLVQEVEPSLVRGESLRKDTFFTRKVSESLLTTVVFVDTIFLLSESVVYLHVTFVVLHAFLKVCFHLCTPCLIRCLMRKDTTRSLQICMGLKPLNLMTSCLLVVLLSRS